MGYYFEDRQSMFSLQGMRVEPSLDVIVKRFVGANPPLPLTYRAYSKRGILRVGDYRYHADFTQFFPDAKDEQYVYMWAKLWADAPSSLMFDITCFGPMVITVNGQEAFRSTIFTERYADAKHRVTIAQQAGWNHYVIRCKKTRGGFGCVIGSWLGKHPYTFMMPAAEREGQEGWIFSPPMSKELPALPGPGMSEKDFSFRWLPDAAWDAKSLKKGQLNRMFGLPVGSTAVGWTKASFMQKGNGKYAIRGSFKGPIAIQVGDQEVFSTKSSSGKINATINVPFGMHDVMVTSSCPRSDWGFELTILDGKEPVQFLSPSNVQGTTQPWIYIGPFKQAGNLDLANLRNMHKTHRSAGGQETYWRLDMPDTFVRMYNDNPLWGRWNYPLGVTLYGLLNSSRAIGSDETEQYIVNHMQLCANTFKYALWDRAQYGGATNVHTLLTSIDSLDDCGSFGSAFLEVAKDHPIEGYRDIADYVADFITNKQDRLEDGTFFRKKMMHIFHENTMWVDDQYMSIPFLCRYFQLTKDRKYIDDAVTQVLGFKKRMYMPELKVMSHIYDLRRDMPTGVPWGRGNGWTIFSISELLAVLPENHPQRPAILQHFRTLCEGYLALQDEQGMWHQVLTHPDSYPEASCTAMFMYAFARGVRFGWLAKPEPYIRAVFKGWEGLNRLAIDKWGNVYGVCRGSEFSFTPEYYKKELSWNLNDTHGVGILLLAGVEVLRLTKYLQEPLARSTKEKTK